MIANSNTREVRNSYWTHGYLTSVIVVVVVIIIIIIIIIIN